MALLRRDNHLLHNVSYEGISVCLLLPCWGLDLSGDPARWDSPNLVFIDESESELCSSFQCLLVHSLKELPVLVDRQSVSGPREPIDIQSKKQPDEW